MRQMNGIINTCTMYRVSIHIENKSEWIMNVKKT